MYLAAINAHMQQRQVEKVTNNINYLQDQIEKTSIAEMREVFYTIIEGQTKNKMLAEASPEYAFVAVSPSMVPEEKSQPQRAFICILGTLLGGILSASLVLVMHYARKSD
jgi:LPS O-antigen subunit length determinant protein (WzzB/FepE family)